MLFKPQRNKSRMMGYVVQEIHGLQQTQSTSPGPQDPSCPAPSRHKQLMLMYVTVTLRVTGMQTGRSLSQRNRLGGTWGTELPPPEAAPSSSSLSLNLTAFHLGSTFPRGLYRPAFARENRLQKYPASFSWATERICKQKPTSAGRTGLCRPTEQCVSDTR